MVPRGKFGWPAPINFALAIKMKTILAKYKIDSVWHFTDQSNLGAIVQHNGLLSLAEIERRKIEIPAPGGNEWSHKADKMKGVHKYVHLAFIDDHPMLYSAKQDGRIPNPIWLKIDSSVLLHSEVRFCTEVYNKSGAEILDPKDAINRIDFEVLFTYMNWRDPEIQARRQTAIKSEILVPYCVPLEKILGYKNG